MFSASTRPNSHQSRCLRVTTASRSMAAQARSPQLSRASATKTTRSVTSVAEDGRRVGCCCSGG